MQTKEKSIIYYAAVVNITHLILCLLFYLFRIVDLADSKWIQLGFIIAELLIWFICSIMFGLGTKATKIKHGLQYSIIALLPILLITAGSAVYGYFTDAATPTWFGYFFLGAAVNFWHKPALLLAVLINNSAYLIFAVNLALILIVSWIGVSYAITVNKLQIRKIKRKKKSSPQKTAKKTTPTKKEKSSLVSQKDPIAEPELADEMSTADDFAERPEPSQEQDDAEASELVNETIKLLEELEEEREEDEPYEDSEQETTQQSE